MTEEDLVVIEHCKKTLSDLHKEYDALNLYEKESKKAVKHDIYLEIATCESIIDECRDEVNSSSLEEIKEMLNVVYHMQLGEHNGRESALVKLDEITSKFLSSKKYKENVNEKLLEGFRSDMDLILGIKEILEDRLFVVRHKRRWFFFPQTILIQRYEKLLADFESIEVKIRENFTRVSEIITSYIVESFHYIYLYFSYIIRYFLHAENQLVLVEIAASIDRFINVMQPLVKSTTLKNENLRNFYVIYELNTLKELIVKHYE